MSEKKKYDGSEMDEIKSPPIIMSITLIAFTGIGILYTWMWSLLLTP